MTALRDAKHQKHHFDLFCQSRSRGEKRLKVPNFLLLKTQDFHSMLFCQGLILHNSRSAQAAAPFHKVNGFNRGHFFLLFILAVNLFVNFQKWSGPLELR